jgi:transposase
MSMVGAVRLEGLVDLQLFDGHSDTQLFEHWVGHHLAPKLRRGDIVLMDNSSIHKSEATKAAIEAAGAELLFLPP